MCDGKSGKCRLRNAKGLIVVNDCADPGVAGPDGAKSGGDEAAIAFQARVEACERKHCGIGPGPVEDGDGVRSISGYLTPGALE